MFIINMFHFGRKNQEGEMINNKEQIEVQDLTGWNGGMKLGIPVIDEQHANLFRIVNNLQATYNMICQNDMDTTYQRFIGAAQEVIDYIKYHFGTEEKLMKLLEYPEYADHRSEHKDFLWELMYLSKQFKDKQLSEFQQFITFLNEWVLTHIIVADKNFADYFINMQHHNKLKVLAWRSSALSTQTA